MGRRKFVKKQIPDISRIVLSCWAATILFSACVCVFACAAGAPETRAVVTADGVQTAATLSGDAEDALAAAGITLLDGDTWTAESRGGTLYVDVRRAKIVCLTVDGQTAYVRTACATVGAFLAEQGVETDAHNRVSAAPDAEITDGMTIEVSRTEMQTVTAEQEVAYVTRYQEDPDAYAGETEVLQEGENGRRRVTYLVTRENGVVTGLKKAGEEMLYQPVDRIVAAGTKQRPAERAPEKTQAPAYTPAAGSSSGSGYSGRSDGASGSGSSSGSESAGRTDDSGSESSAPQGDTVRAWDGTVYTYSKVLNMTATAYTFNSGANITASGAPAQVGIIAADLSYLPMGTVVYIVSASGSWEYGYAVVGDTGVSGAMVDLFYNTYDECIQFGVRDALVYVIG